MPNRIAAPRQHVLDAISDMISQEPIARSRDAFGVRDHDETRRTFDEMRSAAGERVFEASRQIWSEFSEAFANGDLEAAPEQPEARQQLAAVAGAPALEGATQSEQALMVVVGALARRGDEQGNEQRMPQPTAQWHSLTASAPNTVAANFIRNAAPSVFRAMPCFDSLFTTAGTRAVDQLKVAVDYDTTPDRPFTQAEQRLLGGPHAGQQLQRFEQMGRVTRNDVATLAAWIGENGMRLPASKMRFKQMRGYEPEVVFAISEDESFLLVRERREDGAPIDGKSIYAWPGGRQFYAQNPEALQKLVNLMLAEQGIEIDFSPAGRPRPAARPRAPQPEPQRVARREEVPVPGIDAAARAPEPVRRAPVEAPARPQRQAQPPRNAAPEVAPEAAQPPQRRTMPPVTRAAASQRSAAAPAQRFIPLATLRQEMGFQMGLVAARSGAGQEQALYKRDEDGFMVIFADDGKKLPLASEFQVERRDGLQETGYDLGALSAKDGKAAFCDALEALSPGAGPRP